MPVIGTRFLIVEDHDFQRRLLARVLARLGATVVHQAADGAAALNVLADPARPVDVVISDLEMPDMDGLELARRLADEHVDVAIILATAHESERLASAALTLRRQNIRFLGVLEKPASVERIEMLLGGCVAASASKRAEPAHSRF